VDIMEHMFYNASSFNQPINDWDTSNVGDMSWIFENAKSFNQPLDKWNISKASDLKNFFLGSGISKENYCILFKGLYASYWEKYNNSYLGVSYTCP
ncbi:MAG: BspA family leucine-rich repeat surface protein, partial [Proteobacteria bacterium]|nr:BspA family leucine-rich repeat surface protein [Pseudomonadota bacterium]